MLAAAQQLLDLFVLLAAGDLGHTVHFQCSTACDLADDLGGNLQAPALKIHIL